MAKTIDRSGGLNLLRRIIIFSLPIMAMNLLQLLFNAADMVVVGRFAGSGALAAVGATGALISLLVNTFIGMSVGTNVIVAQDYGAGHYEEANSCLHTSLLFSALISVAVAVVGFIFCRPILQLMGTPDDIIDMSTLYMRIYFIGVPANLIYNFGAAALRAIGDSSHATIFLIITGSLNVVLNLLFVICFHMTVDGVAYATIISQYLALALLMRQLIREKSCLRFSLKGLKIDGKKLGDVLRIGVPAGLQSTMFSISNVLIQSAINSFGSALVAGNSAVGNIEGFVGTVSGAISNAAITFTGQAVGAKNYKQIDSIVKYCCILVTTSWAVICCLTMVFARQLLGIYTDDSEVIELAMISFRIRMSFQFLTGFMNVLPGILRGMGYSMMPMINTMVFACLMRIVWLSTVFVWYRSVATLFMCYPVTWGMCAIAQTITLIVVRRREFKKAGVA